MALSREKYRKEYIALGLEGSANKLGVGLVKHICTTEGDFRPDQDYEVVVMKNLRHTYVAPSGEGFLPQETAKHHRAWIIRMIKRAIQDSNINVWRDLSCICFTQGPGMGASLTSVAQVARCLSLMWNVPLVGVNHCIGHIEMGRALEKPREPCVVVYVSGGNSQIIVYSQSDARYKICGETLDLALGNCLDRIARKVGLSNFPAPGLNVERSAREYVRAHYRRIFLEPEKDKLMEKLSLAGLGDIIDYVCKGNEHCALNVEDMLRDTVDDELRSVKPPELINLPYTVKGMDASFSGLFAAAESMYASGKCRDAGQICFAIQETAFAMLTEIAERAMSLTDGASLLLVGGVACNLRLQEMMRMMCEARGAYLVSSDQRYCIDNGAMIGHTGLLMWRSKGCPSVYLNVSRSRCSQRWRTDKVVVTWRD